MFHTQSVLRFKLYYLFSSIFPKFLEHRTIKLNNKQQIISLRKWKSNIVDVYWTKKSKLSLTTQEKQQIYSSFFQNVLRKEWLPID